MYGQPAYGAPYGAPPPAYYPPPPPPPAAQGPMIINLGNNNNSGGHGSPCISCGKDTDNMPRKKIGCVAILWCLCLLGSGFCWLYPLCTDGCKDTELVCVRCQTVKTKIPANCC